MAFYPPVTGDDTNLYPLQYTFTGDNDTAFEFTTSDGRLFKLEEFTSGANADLQLYFGGIEYLKFNENSEIFTDVNWYHRDDKAIGVGTGKDYSMTYVSADTAVKFTSTDIDGGGTDGVVWEVQDGSDTFRTHGNIGMINGGDIDFDPDGQGSQLLYFRNNGDEICRIYSSALRIAGDRFLWNPDEAEHYFGSSLDYYAKYTAADTAYKFTTSDSDGGGTDAVIWQVDDGTADFELVNGALIKTASADGDAILQFTTSDAAVFSIEQDTIGTNADIRIKFGGTNYMAFAENNLIFVNQDLLVVDNTDITIGTNLDYTLGYSSGSTRVEFSSTDVDGGGTDGLIWHIDDGTQYMIFEKGIGVFDTAPSGTTALNATRAGDCRIQLASTDTADIVGIDLYEGFGGGSQQAWRIFNDATGDFAIRDLTGGTSPFKMFAGAPNNTLSLRSNGYVRIGQSTNSITTETLSDYIEVEDSGGNTIKLAIVS